MTDTAIDRPVAILKAVDMDRTIAWYEAAGFSVRGRGDVTGNPEARWCEVARDGTAIQFLAGATPWPGEPRFSGCFYVYVDDIERAFAELRDSVTSEWGIEDRPWGPREIVLTDPDGYFVTLTQAAPPG